MKRLAAILIMLIAPVFALMAEEQDQVDVKKIVFEHLKDSYEWHIMNIGEKEYAISLPVILHSKTTGWHVFMSDRLRENGGYDGFTIAEQGAHAGKLMEVMPDGSLVKPFDLSLTKVALGIIINCLLLLIIIMLTTRWYRRHDFTDPAPGGFVGLIEYVVAMLQDDVIKPAIGKDYRRYTPMLLTMFFFIILSNLMGLVPIFPAGANVTGNIAVTLFLALVTFFTVNLFGNGEYWRDILWPDVPIFLKAPVPILPVIEVFGIFTKPFALTVRLFANMTAGHSIILALTCVIFITGRMGPMIGTPMTVVSVLFMVFMNLLELLVAYVQAYVFTILSAMFIGLSRPGGHEKKES